MSSFAGHLQRHLLGPAATGHAAKGEGGPADRKCGAGAAAMAGVRRRHGALQEGQRPATTTRGRDLQPCDVTWSDAKTTTALSSRAHHVLRQLGSALCDTMFRYLLAPSSSNKLSDEPVFLFPLHVQCRLRKTRLWTGSWAFASAWRASTRGCTGTSPRRTRISSKVGCRCRCRRRRRATESASASSLSSSSSPLIPINAVTIIVNIII
jgi:hypothetical protein